jgi:hypothetical protein
MVEQGMLVGAQALVMVSCQCKCLLEWGGVVGTTSCFSGPATC